MLGGRAICGLDCGNDDDDDDAPIPTSERGIGADEVVVVEVEDDE